MLDIEEPTTHRGLLYPDQMIVFFVPGSLRIVVSLTSFRGWVGQ